MYGPCTSRTRPVGPLAHSPRATSDYIVRSLLVLPPPISQNFSKISQLEQLDVPTIPVGRVAPARRTAPATLAPATLVIKAMVPAAPPSTIAAMELTTVLEQVPPALSLAQKPSTALATPGTKAMGPLALIVTSAMAIVVEIRVTRMLPVRTQWDPTPAVAMLDTLEMVSAVQVSQKTVLPLQDVTPP